MCCCTIWDVVLFYGSVYLWMNRWFACTYPHEDEDEDEEEEDNEKKGWFAYRTK